MIFVDTGFWFASFVPDDPNHARAAAWLRANREPLITTDYCVDETLTLLLARGRPHLAHHAGRLFFEEAISRLYFLGRAEIERAFTIFQQRSSEGWSFTDCTSKLVVDTLGITTAATFDEHFRQFGVNLVP